MDKIHDPEGRAWISDPIIVGDYFREFSEVVEAEKPLVDMSGIRSKWTMKHMGMEDKELFSQVEEVMNIDNLTLEDEVEPMMINDPICDTISQIPKFYKTPIPPAATDKLQTLAHQQDWLTKTKDEPAAKQRRKRQSRHDNDHWFLAEKPEAATKNWDLTDRAVVFCIRIYRPTKQLNPNAVNPSSAVLKYSQEIWCLGHQTLTQLRDYIWCAADLNIVGAQQVDTVHKQAVRARDKYKSGLIYIEGTFYVDRRDKNNIDYSEVIRKWAEDPKREVGPFEVASMEDVRLDSLQLRVGYPYVYIHQGDHEHLVTFTDIRLLGPRDPQKVTEYPLIRCLGNQASRYCMICQSSVAVWVTMNNIRVPEDPFFFCALCYKQFNFIDRKRVGSFQEFRYFDVNVM